MRTNKSLKLLKMWNKRVGPQKNQRDKRIWNFGFQKDLASVCVELNLLLWSETKITVWSWTFSFERWPKFTTPGFVFIVAIIENYSNKRARLVFTNHNGHTSLGMDIIIGKPFFGVHILNYETTQYIVIDIVVPPIYI